jgi:hypothetical protein
MIPPCSLRSTERVDEYGDRAERDDGVSHSRNCVVEGPRNLSMTRLEKKIYYFEHKNT